MLKDNIKDITAAIKYITTENKIEELKDELRSIDSRKIRPYE
jgi:hypothetical protein